MHVRDIQNKGTEGGQTNESLKTRAAHAADAAHDAEAVDWKEAGGHPGAAGREREGRKGVRRLALCGGRGARPPSLRPLSRSLPQSCRPRPLRAPTAPSPGNQLSQSPKTISTNFNTVFSSQGGCWGGAAAAPALPSPSRSPRPPAPPLGGAPVTGVQVPHTAPRRGARRPLLAPPPRGPGARPPRRRATPRSPQPSAAAPARRPHSHSASTSSRGAISSASRCTPRRRRRSCCRRLEPAAGSGGQGRGPLGQRAGGAQLAGEGRGRAAGGRGRDEAARRELGCLARARSPRAHAHARSPGPARGRGRSPRPQPAGPLAGRRQRRSPAAPSLWTEGPRAREDAGARLRPRPRGSLFPETSGTSRRGGRAPAGSGRGVGGREGLGALDSGSIFHRGSSGRDPRGFLFPIHSQSFRFQWVRFWLKSLIRFPHEFH